MSTLNNGKEYKPRLLDKIIDEYLESCGAICIEDPKWCGKTWTSSHHSNSEFLVGNPDNNFSNRELAKVSPNAVLKGPKPRMIDEWQEVPSLWDAARAFVDKSNDYGGKEPILKCIICGVVNAAYKRPDNIYVIPITALKN